MAVVLLMSVILIAIDAGRDQLDEMASGLCQPDAARMTLEQEDAKVFLQRLHAGADARQADAERMGGVTEVEIFGDGERLDQRREGNART